MPQSYEDQYSIKICNGFSNCKIPGVSFSKSRVDRWGNSIHDSKKKRPNPRDLKNVGDILSSRQVSFYQGTDTNKWDTLYNGRIRKMNKRIISQERSMTYVPDKINPDQVDTKNNLFKPKENWTIADGWAYRPRPLGNVVMEMQAREEATLLNSRKKAMSGSTSEMEMNSHDECDQLVKKEILDFSQQDGNGIDGIIETGHEDSISKANSDTSIGSMSLEESLASKYSKSTSRSTTSRGTYSSKSDRTNPLQWPTNGPARGMYKKDMLARASPGPKYYTRDQTFDTESFDKSKSDIEIKQAKLREPKFWKDSGMGIGDRFGGCYAFVQKSQAADSLFYPCETQVRKSIPACTTITTRRTAAGSIYGDISKNISPGPKYNILPTLDKISTMRFGIVNNCFAPPTYAHESLNNDPLPKNHAELEKYGNNLSMGSLASLSMISSSKNKYELHSRQKKRLNKFIPSEEDYGEEENERATLKAKKKEIIQTNNGFFNKSSSYDWKTIYLDCDDVSSYHASRKGATNPPQSIPGL